MRIPYILLLVFITIDLCAQAPRRPYEPLQLTDPTGSVIVPNWYGTFVDSTHSEDYAKIRNLFIFQKFQIPLIDSDAIYSFCDNSGQGGDQQGYYLEKRDLKTGALLWWNAIHLTQDKHKQKIYDFAIFEDRVRIVGVRDIEESPVIITFPPFTLSDPTTMLFVRDYDKVTGHLIQDYTPYNAADSTLHILHHNFNNGGLISTQLIVRDDHIVEVLYNDLPSRYVVTNKLALDGLQILDTDTIFLKTLHRDFPVQDLGNKSFLNVRYVDDTSFIEVLSDDLAIIKDSIQIPSLRGTSRIQVYDVHEGGTVVNENSPLGEQYHYYNKEQNLIATVNDTVLDDRWVVFFTYEGVPYVLSTGLDGSNNILELFRVDGNNTLQSVSILNFVDGRYLSPRAALIEEEQLIIFGTEGDNKGGVNDDNALAVSLIAFDLRDLGLVTSTEDYESRKSMTLFPNPATDRITLAAEDLTTLAGAKILDMHGRTVKQIDRIDDSGQISVQDLSKGYYFISIPGYKASGFLKL